MRPDSARNLTELETSVQQSSTWRSKSTTVEQSAQQLYFPFMLEFVSQSDYVLNELPFMKEQHEKYISITKDPIDFNEFVVDYYCNPDSLWYMAEAFRDKYEPFKLSDGYIVPFDEYLTHDRHNR